MIAAILIIFQTPYKRSILHKGSNICSKSLCLQINQYKYFYGHLVFQNEAIIIPTQVFVIRNKSYKFGKTRYKTLHDRVVTMKS